MNGDMRNGAGAPITWGDFEKVDMRVGVVTDARAFPEARVRRTDSGSTSARSA